MLAHHYGVSVPTIMKYNSSIRNSNSLKIGQEVIIPAVKQVEQYRPAAKKTNSEGEKKIYSKINLSGRYTVRKGDSLWSIANKYNISVDILARANGVGMNDVLSLGKVLRVPVGKNG